MSATAPMPTAARHTAAPALAVLRRTLWSVAALFWGTLAVLEGVDHGWLAGAFSLAFFLAPDFALFLGHGDGPTEKGQLPRRAVPFYNAAHRALVPLALLVAYGFGPVFWPPVLAGLSGWLAHISFDRALGYGLRSKEGFPRG